MTVEIIMLGVIIGLLLILLIARFRRPGHMRDLEKSVAMKKLQLSEKILDSQLNGQPNLMDLVEQAQVGRATSESKDDKDKVTPIGYARSQED